MQQLATHKVQNGFKGTKICDSDSGIIILCTLSIPYITPPFTGAFANNLPKGTISFVTPVRSSHGTARFQPDGFIK
jgi:hypothetical protein